MREQLPADVDYRVMLSFLDFYETMVTFVNFKLFSDLGYHYPLLLDKEQEAKGMNLAALHLETEADAKKREEEEAQRNKV